VEPETTPLQLANAAAVGLLARECIPHGSAWPTLPTPAKWRYSIPLSAEYPPL